MHPAKKVRTILDICVEYNSKGEAAKEFQNVSYLLIFDLTVSSSVCVCVCVCWGVVGSQEPTVKLSDSICP